MVISSEPLKNHEILILWFSEEGTWKKIITYGSIDQTENSSTFVIFSHQGDNIFIRIRKYDILFCANSSGHGN